MDKNFFVGTSGFYYSYWVGSFYPEDLRRDEILQFYSQHFNTVEINSSFYHIPRRKTVERWFSSVPDSFVFSFKLNRSLTHIKPLFPDEEKIYKFFSNFLGIDKRKTIFLIQLPARVKADLIKLKAFIEVLPKDFLYAFEFRNKTWFSEAVYAVLKKKNIAVVLSDSPSKSSGEPLWPKVEVEIADFFYLRFHGSKSLYRSSYTEEELKAYAELIKEKLKKGMQVFAYFNNDAEGHAVENAKLLREMVESKL